MKLTARAATQPSPSEVGALRRMPELREERSRAESGRCKMEWNLKQGASFVSQADRGLRRPFPKSFLKRFDINKLNQKKNVYVNKINVEYV